MNPPNSNLGLERKVARKKILLLFTLMFLSWIGFWWSVLGSFTVAFGIATFSVVAAALLLPGLEGSVSYSSVKSEMIGMSIERICLEELSKFAPEERLLGLASGSSLRYRVAWRVGLGPGWDQNLRVSRDFFSRTSVVVFDGDFLKQAEEGAIRASIQEALVQSQSEDLNWITLYWKIVRALEIVFGSTIFEFLRAAPRKGEWDTLIRGRGALTPFKGLMGLLACFLIDGLDRCWFSVSNSPNSSGVVKSPLSQFLKTG